MTRHREQSTGGALTEVEKLAEEFGLLSAAEVAQLLGSTAAIVAPTASRWRAAAEIFAVSWTGASR